MDADAFDRFVRRHAGMLFGFLLALVGSADDAEDLAQEAFLRAMPRFDGIDKPGAWLRTIARNLVVDRHRRSQSAPSTEFVDGVVAVFDAAPEDERLARLEHCLDGLSPRLREACDLYYLEQLDHREAAERLDVAPAALLKRLERARVMLRDCMLRGAPR